MKKDYMSVNDWTSALDEALRPTPTSPEWKTVKDLVNITGRAAKWVRDRLAAEKSAGRIECRREMRKAIDDTLRLTYAYRMKPTGAGK